LLPHRPSPERPKVVACQEKMTVATDARKPADCGDVEGGVREVPMEDGLEAPSVTPKVDADKIAADSLAKEREVAQFAVSMPFAELASFDEGAEEAASASLKMLPEVASPRIAAGYFSRVERGVHKYGKENAEPAVFAKQGMESVRLFGMFAEKRIVATDASKPSDCGDAEGGVREVPMEDGLEAPSVTPKVDADKIAADSFAKDREDFGALAESSKRRKKREERQADEIDKAEDAPGKAKHDE